MTSRVLIANFSAPELRYMAAELARRRALLTYVARYANQGRWWERTLQAIPGLRDAYSRSLGLRVVPEGLPAVLVTEAGVAQDFAVAALRRLGGSRPAIKRLGQRLHDSTMAAIGDRAAALAGEADCVVAGTGMAQPSFRAASRQGIARVLNFPTAHHRFQRQFFAIQIERQPEFAGLDEPDPVHDERTDAQRDEECQSADLILTGSQFASSSFASQGLDPSKARAIAYGVDTVRFSPRYRTSAGRMRITFVGRISLRKGIGYLLQAYRRFRNSDTELQLVGNMIGDTACLRPYADMFTHLPHMPQNMLPRIYGSADVFVFPSLLEGLGLVVLEAMACGCPVIVSANGPGDVVRHGVDGFVVPAGDADAIEEALYHLRDPELRHVMGKAARQQAEHYSWARYSAQAADAVLAAATRGSHARD